MSEEITRLLHRLNQGDDKAMQELTPLVYHELKLISARIFRAENPGHTLQPTALVSELYEKLAGSGVQWNDRRHFYALSARLMRRILVDHARNRRTAKRGGGQLQVTLSDESPDHSSGIDLEVLELDKAIAELALFDERKAEMLELHYFGGLTYAELATTLGVGESTVHRNLRLAKAWLKNRLADPSQFEPAKQSPPES